MPLFIYPPAPNILTNDSMVATVTAAVTAGAIYFYEVRLYAAVTVTQMRCSFGAGSPTGNVDMGIFDSTGTNGKPGKCLASTGAILSATGLFTQNLSANTPLSPGVYWLAFIDTVADSPGGKTLLTAGISTCYRSTGTGNANLGGVGASAPALQTTSLGLHLDALILGGYS